MKKIIQLIFLLFINFILAQTQVLHKYPEGQKFYKGGNEKFYEDAHQYLIQNNIKPCENKSEVYLMKILVKADGTINYVKDPDELAVINNKCAFDLGKKILANLKDYTPAEENGLKSPALTRILFYPNELFSSDHYMINDDLIKEPEFPGGIQNYRKKFISCFDTNGYTYSQNFKFIINFEVDTQGNIQNIYIDTDFENDKFVKMIVDCVIPRKLKFKPGTYNGSPVTQSFKLPVKINAE
jgi:hypothetical protein